MRTFPRPFSIPRASEVAGLAGRSGSCWMRRWMSTTATTSWSCYAVGQGVNGALGTGDTDDRDVPTKLETVKDIVKVSAGWGHTAFLDSEGRVLLSGRTHDVQQAIRFGRMRTNKSFMSWFYDVSGSTDLSVDAISPRQVTDFTGTKNEPISTPRIKDIKAYAGLTAMLSTVGDVFMIGHNFYGQCGIGNREVYSYTPQKVVGFPNDDCNVVSVDIGFRHAIALTEKGNIYTWGKGERGQLGHGPSNLTDYTTATKIKDLPGRTIAIAAGFNHCLALQENGDVYRWGKFQRYRKFSSNLKERYDDAATPEKVEFESDTETTIVSIWAGQNHSIARSADGNLYQWGRLSDRIENVSPAVTKELQQEIEKEQEKNGILSQMGINAPSVGGMSIPPVKIDLDASVLDEPNATLTLGSDYTYLTSDTLNEPLIWDWGLEPLPLSLHDPSLVDFLKGSQNHNDGNYSSSSKNNDSRSSNHPRKIHQVARGWNHTVFLVDDDDDSIDSSSE